MEQDQQCNSFVRFALKLIRAEDQGNSTSNKKEYYVPKMKFFDLESKYTSPTKQQSLINPFSLKKKIYKQKQISPRIVNGCNCQKSKCSKSYCDCYAAGKQCNENCNCRGCQNNNIQIGYKKNINRCNCKRTGCTKNYCECHLNKIKCTFLCNCVECCNQEDSDSESKTGNKILGVLSSNFIENSKIFEKLKILQ